LDVAGGCLSYGMRQAFQCHCRAYPGWCIDRMRGDQFRGQLCAGRTSTTACL